MGASPRPPGRAHDLSLADERTDQPQALELTRKFKAMIVEGAEPAPELGDLRALAGVHKLHARVKCATLAWNTLEEALKGQ
nr:MULTISPECIES: hypothetical protein [unclassified Meiothermus]